MSHPAVLLQVDEMGKRRVWAVMKSGDRWEGDILVGADGIYSKVRFQVGSASRVACREDQQFWSQRLQSLLSTFIATCLFTTSCACITQGLSVVPDCDVTMLLPVLLPSSVLSSAVCPCITCKASMPTERMRWCVQYWPGVCKQDCNACSSSLALPIHMTGSQPCHAAQVRQKLVGNGKPTYSEYTCYTGIADFTPPDIDTVGYRVFLGNGRYFVSSDVGGGKMQWYGFHKEPAGTYFSLCTPAVLSVPVSLNQHVAIRFNVGLAYELLDCIWHVSCG